MSSDSENLDCIPLRGQSQEKPQLRRRIKHLRQQQCDKDVLSQLIMDCAWELAMSFSPRTVLFYVDVRDEVRTTNTLRQLLSESHVPQKPKILVPYCSNGELELIRLESMDELELGSYGILEPGHAIRSESGRRVAPVEVDVALVPGVAFDLQGRRLGHGKGYYDKLLAATRPDCKRIGIAFACQLVELVPTEAHDLPMDFVVTEQGVIRRKN